MPKKKMLRLDGSTLWLEGDSRRLTDEDRVVLGELRDRASAWNRRHGDAWLAEIGRELYGWLGTWAVRLRDSNLRLDVVATDAVVREAPWELLHDGSGFLVDGGFEVVRRLEPAAPLPVPPPQHGLTLVFMAASPRSSRPGLARLRYEDEEAAILRAVGEHKLHLSVEETGSASGLRERLADLAAEAPSPVVHITGHGTASPPSLLLEDDQGREALTSAGELLGPEGAGYRLTEASLVVVSACETAVPDVGSFAVALVEGGVRAALGWSASVSDVQATIFASTFYAQLREGDPLDRALNAARLCLKGHKDGAGTDWHLARLVVGPQAGGPVVKKNGRLPALSKGSRAFGGNRKVEIATRLQFVGRRPQIQEALRSLADGGRAGVLITGLGHQGKSSLAGRLADRHRGPIAVCWGAEELTAPAILRAVHKALGCAGDPQAEADRGEMALHPGGLQGKLVRVLDLEERPLLLVLDDVEQVLDQDATPVQVKPEFERTLRGVLEAFGQLTGEGRRHRLVLTSRVAFHLAGWGGEDLVAAHLHEVRLAGMLPVERALLPAAREASSLPADARSSCLEASAGNPGLAALLLGLATDLAATGELARLPELLAGHPGVSPRQGEMDAWMEEVVGVLVGRLTDTQKALLHLSGVLPGPVPREAVLAALGPATGATERDAARLEALGLWEQHRDEGTGGPAVCPARLALQSAPPLDAATRRDLARSVLTELRPRWSPPPQDVARSQTMVQLCLTAERGEGLAAPAEVVLASLLAVHEMVAARQLGRQVVARLGAEGLPVPDGVRWRVADALEDDSTDEALELLEGVSDEEAMLLRRGRLLLRVGDLDGAERDFVRFGEVRKDDPRDRALALGHRVDILEARGQLDEALRIRQEEELPVYERLGDVRSRAVTMGKIADILQVRGQFDEALLILREQVFPLFERFGDVRERAIIEGKIADILQARGQHDEALRIRQDEELPVYERLGEVRLRALTMGKIADILQARGQLDEALRIRQDEELPVYERLGEVRLRAVTMGNTASILQARGQLDEALHMLREKVFPLFEGLGDVRQGAVTMGKIADILHDRGQLDEALHILREQVFPLFERLGDVRLRAVTMGKIADILQARGQLDEALRIYKEEQLPVYERIGDVRERALTKGRIADILQVRGQLDEALRIRQDEELPVYERNGDVRLRAVTVGKIADIFQARGRLDEALRIRQDEELPVYERLGDARSRVVTMEKVASGLQARGQLDEALRVYQEELLPVYERLGDVRKRALTMGWIADILQARGQLDEALRIRQEELLPVYERDVRERAVTMGKIADILQARGQLDEALRIRQDEELPIYERLGDVRSLLVARVSTANTLHHRRRPDDHPKILGLLRDALAAAREHSFPVETRQIEDIMQKLGLPVP